MINIDFNNINDQIVYEAFHVDGNEAEALNDSYLELFELMFFVKHFSLKKAFKFPFFIQGISLISAGN